MAWKDFDINFNIVNSDIKTIEDHEAIVQSLANCFLIEEGSNLCNLDFGLDVRSMLRQSASSPVFYLIETQIRTKVGNYEPRISIDSILFFYKKADKMLEIDIHYKILNEGDQIYSFKFNFDVKK